MQSFTIDGQQMQYLDQGLGEVILFGHSYLWDHRMWAPQVEVLSQHYRCIVPELWAHGGSQAAPAAMTCLQDYARHLLALMDHLGIERFAIVGLSVGGMWGAELALLAPERVRALVMMDTFVGAEPQPTHARYFQMLDAITQLQAVPPAIVDAVVPMFFARDTAQTNPELVQSFRASLSALSGAQAVEVARIGRMIFGRRDMLDELAQLAMPVLIAVGEQDIPRPVAEAELMQSRIAGSELAVIEGAGHISNLEQAEWVAGVLGRFLAATQ